MTINIIFIFFTVSIALVTGGSVLLLLFYFLKQKRDKRQSSLACQSCGESVAKEFLGDLQNNKFTMSRSKNNGEDYSVSKQKRDTEMVEAFIETNLFQDLISLNF